MSGLGTAVLVAAVAGATRPGAVPVFFRARVSHRASDAAATAFPLGFVLLRSTPRWSSAPRSKTSAENATAV